MSANQQRHTKDEALLVTVAESIGSTLGTIAAKASAVPDALSHTSFVQTAEREGKKFVRKSKTVARKIKRSVSQRVKGGKLVKPSRGSVRREGTPAKRLVRSISTKKKTIRRIKRKK
jgi:hypothetical protein